MSFWSKENKTQIGIEMNIFIKDCNENFVNSERCFYRTNKLYDGKVEKYFCIETGMIETIDLNIAAEEFLKLYNDNVNEVKALIQQEDNTVIFCIIPVIENDEKPAMHFSGEFMQLIRDLKADIDIDYYYVILDKKDL